MKQYSLIYKTPTQQVFRYDTQAADQQEAYDRLQRQKGVNPINVLHTIEHAPIDESRPQLRFLGMPLPRLPGELPPDLPTRKQARLLRIHLPPTWAHLDNVQTAIIKAVHHAGVYPDSDLIDPIMARLKEEAGDAEWLFNLDDWPYDTSRFTVTQTSDLPTWVTVDWEQQMVEVFDSQDDALQRAEAGEATLYLELWPAMSAKL